MSSSIFQSTPPVKAATEIAVLSGYTGGFQSTPPVKAATCSYIFSERDTTISIHAAREGGDRLRLRKVFFVQPISIHAAREGGDAGRHTDNLRYSISIHAAREGGDPSNKGKENPKPISIHAAREGGDMRLSPLSYTTSYFNPRRP